MRNKKFFAASIIFCVSIGVPNSLCTAQASEDKLSAPMILRLLGASDNQNGNDWHRRQEVERLLNDYKAEAPALLTNALDSTDPEVQKNASELLPRMSSSWEFVISDDSLATILGILKSSRVPAVKCNLVRTIGHVGPRNDKLQPILLDYVKNDSDASVRTAAADAIAGFLREEKPSSAGEAVKGMCNALKSDISPHVRRSIAQSMGNLPGPSDEVISALIHAMDDNYKQVRTSACSALARFGARSKAALPILLKMFEEEKDWPARQQTLNAMVQIEKKSPKVIEAMIVALDEPHLASTSMIYLQQLREDAVPAVSRLVKLLESDDNLHIRVQAANTLGSIGPAAKKALPALSKCSSTSDAALRSSIDIAIRKIGVTRPQVDVDNNSGGAVL